MKHTLKRVLAWAFLLLFIGACDDLLGGGDGPRTDAEVGQVEDANADSDSGMLDADAGLDHLDAHDASAAHGTSADTPTDTVIVLAAATGTLALDFEVAIDGSGAGDIGDIIVDANLASVSIGDEVIEGFVYERQPWPSFDLTLYQTFLVAEDRFVVLWFYCSGGALTSIYYEGTAGTPLTNVSASGTCTETLGPTSTTVETVAVSLPEPQPIGGYRVSGAEIDIQPGSVGGITLGGRNFDVRVFEDVDCSTSCGSPGWYELHALIVAPDETALGYAIVYLRQSGSVEAYYGLSLPDFAKLPGRSFDATWELQ